MIAFLSAEQPVLTPFARTLRVIESAPWHEKRFAARLRELGIGTADIRRRGLAGDVAQIHRRLGLRGPGAATIVLTRVADKPWGLICTPVAAEPAMRRRADLRHCEAGRLAGHATGRPADQDAPSSGDSRVVDRAAEAGDQVIAGASGAVRAATAVGAAVDVAQVGLVATAVDRGLPSSAVLPAALPAARTPAQFGAPTLVPPSVHQPDCRRTRCCHTPRRRCWGCLEGDVGDAALAAGQRGDRGRAGYRAGVVGLEGREGLEGRGAAAAARPGGLAGESGAGGAAAAVERGAADRDHVV